MEQRRADAVRCAMNVLRSDIKTAAAAHKAMCLLGFSKDEAVTAFNEIADAVEGE